MRLHMYSTVQYLAFVHFVVCRHKKRVVLEVENRLQSWKL